MKTRYSHLQRSEERLHPSKIKITLLTCLPELKSSATFHFKETTLVQDSPAEQSGETPQYQSGTEIIFSALDGICFPSTFVRPFAAEVFKKAFTTRLPSPAAPPRSEAAALSILALGTKQPISPRPPMAARATPTRECNGMNVTNTCRRFG